MTRLVVHAGTHATDWEAARQQLVTWRAALADAGVRLSPGDDADSWAATARDLASGEPPQELVKEAQAAVHDGATALVLGSEQLEDQLRDEAALRHLAEFAAGLGMALTVTIALRDQLGYLNELYCDRVTHLQMARDFQTFVSAPQPAERFDYATALDLVTRAADIEVAAVPYAEMSDGSQARDLLGSAGLWRADLDGLPPGPTREYLPGPVLIAAMRLLFKRIWRLGMFKTLSRGRLLHAARILRDHAHEHNWDTVPFWGWTETAREAAVLRYRADNDAVAGTLWGKPWPAAWESGTYVDVDLAASDPALVVDLLVTVDNLVKDLQKAKGAVTTGAAAD